MSVTPDKELAGDDAVLDAEARFDFVRFTLSDIHGISRSKLVPRRHFSNYFKHGICIVAGCVGYGTRAEIVHHREVKHFGNVVAKPMPGTLHSLPWAADGKHRIGEVYCETSWMSGELDARPQGACPRYVARTQLERLSELGYQFMSGYEAEFFVYRKDGDHETTSCPMFTGIDVYSTLTLSEHEDMVCSMVKGMSASGVDVLAVHTEYGPGQLEFATGPKFGIESPDQMFTLKEAAKEMSVKRGWRATFMTKPTSDTSGCTATMHFNGSLWKSGKNVFHDAVTHQLSTVGRHWTAGLLKHAAALTALCLPTVNCYRFPTVWVPSSADWGVENRTTMLRVVASSPHGTYIENRLPSSAANPYVVLAATVAAGIDGLVNRLELPAADQGDKLPSSLSEALSALEADKVMCAALSEEFVRWFVTIKREVEIAKVEKAKESGLEELEIEREMYFKLL